ncbi:Molybdopterin biosynthesis protein MoeA [Methanosarcina sp. Kolksee]|uniref:molybdopterin biosynthesis protein n=1 Tax=Methanosarcina sp. Kolksee TaxID=1434099 RepID=UPI000615A92C|nr:molybdopterin biosynthesis protein [Methanosarcina sp. Kolksee]AKB48627.1 Molybdopterin biosynthesis protein MoeA [Methanosarcina sp. Kolksee]
MKRKEFRELISVEKAREIINNLQVFPRQERLTLENAYGKILAEDIVTEINVPPFPRAIMDGYAVRAEDTYECSGTEPVELKLIGNLQAGSDVKFNVSAGEAVEIATGAPIPEGANAVVMVEYSSEEDGTVSIYSPVTVGENIMKAGSDIQKGERMIRAGRKLGTREIGVLASVGKKDVPVLKLQVGILSTGDELVRPGEKLTFGKIYDANSYTLYAGIHECGAFPLLYGIVEDNKAAMKKVLETAVSECALILTSGSTSSGSGDVMYRLVDEIGETLAHGISVKPGKPVVIGIIQGVPIIGLPGNPTSALTIFNEFVAPLLRKNLGEEKALKKTEKGVIGTRFRSEGRQQLLPVGLIRGRVYPADKGSGAITSLFGADGFIEIPPSTEFIEAGTPVEVTLFGEVEKPDILIAGGFCPGLDLLEDLSGLRFRTLYTSSSGGFSAIAANTADIAGVNMPSRDHRGQDGVLYNVPTIENMGLSGIVLVKGYRREVGLLVRQDRPVSGLFDLPGKHLINRNRGSGTRALLDLKIAEFIAGKRIDKKEFTDSIPGYASGAKSEVAVCEAIVSENAEVGVGIRNCTEKNGLQFVKFAEEEYDFLIRKEILETPEVCKFLETLNSAEFASKLPEGIHVYERTGEIIFFE